MKYTITNNRIVDGKIDEITEQIVDEIVAYFHPKSIILKGSFGRDEVSVKFDNGMLVFFSDCEVVIISKGWIKRRKAKKVSEELTKKLGLKVEITDIEPELKFCIALRLWNKMLPTIDNYELKYGSRIIYGENFLEKLPNFKTEDIPIWEGIRLLFNRMIESLQYFSIDYLIEYPSKEKERKLFFWINKIILACQDALLISAKKYHYSYKVRNETFQKIFPKYFKALDKQIPNFLSLTIKATEYKLNSSKIYFKDVVRFWFYVVEITDKVFKYIIEKEMGITFASHIEFQEKCLKHPYIKKKYYRGLSPNPIYQNLRSAVKMWIFGYKIPTIKLMLKIGIPWTHIVYSVIPSVYFNSGDDQINKIQLKIFDGLNLQKKLYKEEKSLKRHLFEVWQSICY